MKDKEYVFPENNWYIKITDENREVLNNWKIKQNYSDSLYNNPQYKYVYCDGLEADVVGGGLFFEITFDQLKKYVLKEEESQPISENLDYLIPLFKKLNIV
jgi:hypothetical protein